MTSQFKNVEERLEKALARMDTAVTLKARENQSKAPPAIDAEAKDAQRKKQEEISNRLDSAIDRLQRMLQG